MERLSGERIEPATGQPRPMQQGIEGMIMTADRAGLGFVGFIFAGITAAVMLIACTVVLGHVEGRWSIDSTPQAMASLQ
jgi:hypothetical protein